MGLIGQKSELILFKRWVVRCGAISSDFFVLGGYIAVLKVGPVGIDWLPFAQNTSPSPSPYSHVWKLFMIISVIIFNDH